MIRSRMSLIGLCAMLLGLLAFTAGSASAAEWLILNSKSEVKTAKELPATIVGEIEEKTVGTLLTKLTGIILNVSCTQLTLENTKLESGGALTNGMKITFNGCTVPVPAGNICTVKSPGRSIGTLATKEFKGALQTNGEILIEPKTGTAFAELVFEGKECTLPEGAQSVNGVIWLKNSEVEKHLVKHLIEESKAKWRKNAKGELKLGTVWIGADTEEHLETSLEGSTWHFLSGVHAGLPWGATLP